MIWAFIAIEYALFVLGGRLGIKPAPITLSNFWYMWHVHPFFYCNRWLNYHVVCPLLGDTPRWETISSHIGRDYPDSKAERVINLIALDNQHCVKYIGI